MIKIRCRILQRQLKATQKYLEKDKYLQKKGRKLLISYYYYNNNIILEYQKIINLLHNTPNQPSKFRTKILVEIDDDSPGMYNTNSEIKFKTIVLKSSLCDYSDKYILAKKIIMVIKS